MYKKRALYAPGSAGKSDSDIVVAESNVTPDPARRKPPEIRVEAAAMPHFQHSTVVGLTTDLRFGHRLILITVPVLVTGILHRAKKGRKPSYIPAVTACALSCRDLVHNGGGQWLALPRSLSRT